MRLFELIDFNPRKTQRKGIDYTSNLSDYTSARDIGSGSFGTGYETDSNKRLNQITKLGKAGAHDDYSEVVDKKNMKDDGYLTYLQAVNKFNESGKTNPYFPVIHDFKIYRGSDKKLHYRANLEKLVPFMSPKIIGNKDLMESLHERMFGVFLDMEGLSSEEIADFIRRRLIRGLDNPEQIADPKLQQALALINDVLATNSQFNDDFHTGNLMWRITGTMPQMVLLDPVS